MNIEKEFEIQLIDRKQIPIEPTQAGWLFYGDAMALLKQYDHMKVKMANYQKDHTQILSIEYAAITDLQSLLKFISAFKENNPNIKLELNKVLLKNVSEFLQKGIYDIAIAFDSEFKDKNWIEAPFSSEGMVTFAQAIRLGKMDAFTDDFKKLTGQTPVTVKYMFEHNDEFQIGDRHSLDI